MIAHEVYDGDAVEAVDETYQGCVFFDCSFHGRGITFIDCRFQGYAMPVELPEGTAAVNCLFSVE